MFSSSRFKELMTQAENFQEECKWSFGKESAFIVDSLE